MNCTHLTHAAYDSEPLRQLERELGHVPIVAMLYQKPLQDCGN